MSAKGLKAIADIGITLGYSGDELKQFVNDERMRMERRKSRKGSVKKLTKKLRGCIKRRKLKYSVKKKQLRNSVKWKKMKEGGNLSLKNLNLNQQRNRQKLRQNRKKERGILN